MKITLAERESSTEYLSITFDTTTELLALRHVGKYGTDEIEGLTAQRLAELGQGARVLPHVRDAIGEALGRLDHQQTSGATFPSSPPAAEEGTAAPPSAHEEVAAVPPAAASSPSLVAELLRRGVTATEGLWQGRAPDPRTASIAWGSYRFVATVETETTLLVGMYGTTDAEDPAEPIAFAEIDEIAAPEILANLVVMDPATDGYRSWAIEWLEACDVAAAPISSGTWIDGAPAS